MSIITDVKVEGDHGCGLPQGVLWTFDLDIMFSSVLMDREGLLHEVPTRMDEVEGWTAGVDTEPFKDWMNNPRHRITPAPESTKPLIYTGYMVLNMSDVDARQCWALFFRNGKLQALRPGDDQAWSAEVSLPQGEQGEELDLDLDGKNVRVRGLPEPPEGKRWSLRHRELYAQPSARDEDEPYPFHGWMFTDNGVEGWMAMRLASGRVQWTVPVVDGVAHTPVVLAELWPDAWRSAGGVCDPLAAVCPVLPTDYTDYGGDAVRWDRHDRVDEDCSSGCRWWRPVYDEVKNRVDGDWGVCSNPKGPRRGLLTWEHQAGRACFEG